MAIGRAGTLIGALPIAEYHDRDFFLVPGAQIVLYTDGVSEARREGEFYGEDRLRALIARRAGSAATTADAILDDVLAFQSGQPRDDIAVVTLRVPTGDDPLRAQAWQPSSPARRASRLPSSASPGPDRPSR
jgi:phosphoserine phosphatase RsbU/P